MLKKAMRYIRICLTMILLLGVFACTGYTGSYSGRSGHPDYDRGWDPTAGVGSAGF